MLSVCRAGGCQYLGLEGDPPGLAELLEVGINLLPRVPIAGFLLLFLAAGLAGLALPGLMSFLTRLPLCFGGKSPGGGVAGFDGGNQTSAGSEILPGFFSISQSRISI